MGDPRGFHGPLMAHAERTPDLWPGVTGCARFRDEFRTSGGHVVHALLEGAESCERVVGHRDTVTAVAEVGQVCNHGYMANQDLNIMLEGRDRVTVQEVMQMLGVGATTATARLHESGWASPGKGGRVWRATATSDLERFWESVDVGLCWEWTGTIKPNGYGNFQASGHRTPAHAHRWLWSELVGHIPEGIQLDHLCRNRRCVNPDHLDPVTQQENLRRGAGVPAQRARQTHCIHGHAFDSVNTYITKRGERKCRTCGRNRKRKAVKP